MRALLTALIYLQPAGVTACPLCHTTTADEVRQGLVLSLKEGALGVLLPFLALGLIIGWMNWSREKE